MRENNVNLGLNNLRDQLQQAQAANQQQNGKPGKAPAATTAIWKKRWRAWKPCEAACSSSLKTSRARATRPGQGRQSNPLQRGGQPGQQPGQAAQPGQQGQQPGTARPAGSARPDRRPKRPAGAKTGTAKPAIEFRLRALRRRRASNAGQRLHRRRSIDQAYRESLRDLNQIRDFIRQNPDFQGDYSNLSRALNPGYVSNDAELSQRLSHEVLPEMERLELELRRKLEDTELRSSPQRRHRNRAARLLRCSGRLLPEAESGQIRL